MKLFNLENKTVIKECKPTLETLYSKYKRVYTDLFFHEKDVDFNKIELMPLVKTKILKKINGMFRANVQVFPLSGKFICTDFVFSIHNKKQGMYLRKMDDVWAILPHESAFIAKNTEVREGDTVLDLATGSGIIALFCADKAKKVIATDINPKAINYAMFNAILNDKENKIEFRLGDLFKPVIGQKFDLVIWNGPTVAAPPVDDAYPLHSYGGADGAEFAKRFLHDVWNYLNVKGRIKWYDCSLGSRSKSVIMQKILQEYSYKNIFVKVQHLNQNGPIPLSLTFKYFEKYRSGKFPLAAKQFNVVDAKTSEWKRWLNKQNLTHLYFSLININESNKFSFKEEFVKNNIVDYTFIFREYHFMSYTTIQKKLRICESY